QEQVIGGYPAEDLVQWKSFVDQQWAALQRFARASTGFKAKTMFTFGLTVGLGGNLYNAVAAVSNGLIHGIVPKEKLPTYGVFYENRTFTHGYPGMDEKLDGHVPFGDLVFELPFGTFALEVCEDIWSPDGPMRRRAYSGAELIINASASPWRAGVTATRREMLSTRAGDNQATVVYVNQVGGNDSLVFDGGAYVNQNGRMMFEGERWKEAYATAVVDLDRTLRLRRENTTWRTDCERFFASSPRAKVLRYGTGNFPNRDGYRYPAPAHKSFFMPAHVHGACPRDEFFRDMTEAMVMGMDYLVKTKAFRKIGIALSGGKDSVLTLCIARLWAERHFGPGQEAAVKDFIHCFSMPTRFNSATTKGISHDVCEELGVTFKELSIEEAFDREVEAAKAMLSEGEMLTPITVQNIQARIRGARMWNWANSAGGFWLQTSNMSEKAVGYSTVGGDLMGAFSLIANEPKTVVIEHLRWLCHEHGWEAVAKVLETKASAELADGQEDEKDLMPFPVLDACFALFAGEKLEPAEVYRVVREMWTDEELAEMAPNYKEGVLRTWVERFTKLFVGSIFKWVLTPESVHLGGLDLDRERALQLPVVQSREWLGLEKLAADKK
ncbi:MAG TPA: NAD(+) synthase, partial [Candidatus Binatia bacterium]|nr:NAD(+) synthase [Candidatus Binatia bacterium]